MKKLFVLFFFTISTIICAQSYNQLGYVKEKGSREKVGDRIEGVRIKVSGKKGAYQTDSIGEFSIDGLGRIFVLERVEKQGYELLDYEVAGTDIEVSSVPLRIVMVDKHKFSAEKEAILKELLKEFEKNQQLQYDLSNLKKSFSEMADRLARVDYDLMSQRDQEIRICMEEGNFKKADSLILSKGSIQERINYSKKGDKSIIDDCYILAINAILRNDIDSALFLLEQRVEIAPKDINCLLDVGYAYLYYMSNAKKAYEFFSQALFFAERKFGVSHSITLKCNTGIVSAYLLERNFKGAISLLHDCISVFNAPNIPILYEQTEINDLEAENQNGINIVEAEDSFIVAELYSLAANIYAIQGNSDLAVKCIEQGLLYSNDSISMSEVALSAMILLIMGNEHRLVLDEFLLPVFKLLEDRPYGINTAMLDFYAATCYRALGLNDSSNIYLDKILDYFDDVKLYENQFYYLALIMKSENLIDLGYFDAALDVVSKAEEVFKLYVNPSIDIIAQLENCKGRALMFKGDMYGAEKSFLNGLSLIDAFSKENKIYNGLKGVLASNLTEVYMQTGRVDDAKEAIGFALDELRDAYKSIIHYKGSQLTENLIATIYRKAEIEERSKDYLEAFRSYCMAYDIIDDSKHVKYIDRCFQTASKNKKYKRTKDFRILKKEYNEFVNRINE